MRNRVALSIILPCLNESGEIGAALDALAPLRRAGAEIIVVDGGSSDGTADLARNGADHVISAPHGRARQMNAGADRARGDVFLFLHADTRLPSNADQLVLEGLRTSGKRWGRFDVTISGRQPLFRIIALSMNWRSRLTSIATGDQAIFAARELFEEAGGFPPIALMEDIALTAALCRFGRPLCLKARVTTSGRRWEKHGVVRTLLLMWRLRLAYWLGACPERLAKRYVPHQRS